VTHGCRIGIRVSDGAVLERLREGLPPACRPLAGRVVERLYSLRVGSEPRAGVRQLHLLYADTALLARSAALPEVLDRLESDLRLYVAEHARRRIFVHAGVVGVGGRALVLPGRSFTGKSTLVAALVRAGASYYGDEYAVFDGRGRVHPYPTPLSIRGEGGRPPRRMAAEGLGRPSSLRPLPVGRIVIARYRAGASWRPRRLSPGEAVLALLAQAVAARSRAAEALAALQAAVLPGAAFRGVRGEAEELAARLVEEMSGEAASGSVG